ncbi:MAG: glycosyltransferase family 9 protein [Candidatus Eremiobacteraeota bacterium]|nr:glycosyltransferase family 9 protein [Candidatus Eremiobacteraeota bacterium]
MRILAVRQDNSGDVLLTGPAVRALARSGDVYFACGPNGEAAARLLPGVAGIVRFTAEWIEGEPLPVDSAALAATVAELEALAIDEAVIFTSFHQSPLPTALVLRLAGVARIHAISVDYPGSLLDTRLRIDDDIHEVERSLALVCAAGFEPASDDDRRLRVLPLPSTAHLVQGRFVAVQPGATVPARRWQPEKMRALVERLSERRHVVVLGSAAEAALTAFVAGGSGALDLAGKTTFAEFAGLVARADALIVGNSAGIHVASATGTPVVTIFPPTIAPVRFAPWQTPSVVLGDHAVACAGCRARVCPQERQYCTAGVTTDDVLAALAQLGALRTPVPA